MPPRISLELHPSRYAELLSILQRICAESIGSRTIFTNNEVIRWIEDVLFISPEAENVKIGYDMVKMLRNESSPERFGKATINESFFIGEDFKDRHFEEDRNVDDRELK